MKKRMLLLFTTVFITLLAACGGGGLAGDMNDAGANEPSETEDQENSTEAKEEKQKEEAAPEPVVEIVKSTGGAWKNSIDTVWVHSSAIFENTGDVPVQIGETQMNFKDTEGGILGTSPMNYAVPRVVAPGEQAYITTSTTLDGVTDAAQYGETSYNFSFDATEETANLLEVSGIKTTPGTDGYSAPYTVTGVVTNTTEEMQDDIRIAAALLAEDGSLLGVLNGSVDVGVNPGSEAGFELNYPEVPADIKGKVANVEVKAYGWTW